MTPYERVTRLRRLAHMTQYQLSVLTGINSAFISMFENGLRPLGDDQVDLLERVLNDAIQTKAAEARDLVRKKSPSPRDSRRATA